MICVFAQMGFGRMNWNDLRHFLGVARTGRFLSAAKRLGASHTTVARRISALALRVLGGRLRVCRHLCGYNCG
jgi:hypothetical protein